MKVPTQALELYKVRGAGAVAQQADLPVRSVDTSYATSLSLRCSTSDLASYSWHGKVAENGAGPWTMCNLEKAPGS